MKVGSSYARTDAGRKRRGNEDAYVCRPPLFAIADGMGGAQAGEVASALAAEALTDTPVDGGGERRLVELIREANRRVHERASTDAATSGMGTTITVALVEDDGRVTFGHVGDSRAYLLRQDAFEQLTDDHSLVAELVRRGELSPAEAEVHPQRSVITRALGTDPDIDVDTFSVPAEAGDLFLICSDGLSDMVDEETIASILRAHRGDLAEASRALVQAANRAGGEDNITAVLFEIAEGDQAAGEPDEKTRELATSQDEDTLHPEDHVLPPPPAPSAVDTMVAPVDTIPPPPADAETEEAAAPSEDEEEATFARKALALAVIVALCVLIVVLVVWGLAR
ncbi:MAG TPA: Stp1/IreP family PP2C-type Ser/Thr phosphatase [Gaiellaceae bacterium]|nr:Stp1/IreP family PP2C-type Ser/Thr phosphatase [Gaiellaceae bacterium]